MRHYRGRRGFYYCVAAKSRMGCDGPEVKATPVHEALLREAGRLGSAPWEPVFDQRLLGVAGRDAATATAQLDAALATEKRAMAEHVRAFTAAQAAFGDLTAIPADVLVAFRDQSKAIATRIAALEEQRRRAVPAAVALVELREVHALVADLDLATHIARDVAGDPEAERDLLRAVISSARVVAQVPQWNPTWVGLEVEWTPAVRTLLEIGALALADPMEPPQDETRREKQARYLREWRARKRAERAGATPPE
jgi:hypothetical protein